MRPRKDLRAEGEGVEEGGGLSLSWSLRPILAWMSLMGYEMDLSGRCALKWRRFKLIYSAIFAAIALMRASVMILYIISEANYVASEENIHKNATIKFNTEIWNLSIMYTSEGLQALGIVLSMIIFVHLKWDHLRKILHDIRNVLMLPKSIISRLRTASYCATIYIIAVKQRVNAFE